MYFMPSMSIVLCFSVDHDNGYSAALSAALTSGYRDRLVLLQAHQEIAREIRALNLTTFYIDGLFLERSLQMITPPGLARPPQTTSWASAASTTTHTNSPPPMTPKAYTVTATPSKPFSPVTPRGGDMKLVSMLYKGFVYLFNSIISRLRVSSAH